MINILCAFCMCWNLTYEQEKVTNYINDAFKGLDERYKTRALTTVDDIVIASQKYKVPVLLIAITIFHESAFKSNAISKNGKDIGLMQLRRGASTKSCKKIEVPKNNIDCGTRWLRKGYEKCESWSGSINYYMTGKCSPLHWRAKRRYKKYERSRKNISKVDDKR